MTPKERYLAAIRHEEPDKVPVAAELDIKFQEMLTGKKHVPVKSYVGGGVAVTKHEKMSDHETLLHNQKLKNDATRKLGTDEFRISDYWLWPKGYEPRYLDQYTFVDWWGKVYHLVPKVNTNYWIDGIIKTEEDLDNFTPPDPDEMNYELVDFVVEDAGEEYPVLGCIHLVGMFPYLMMGGIDKFSVALYLNPSFAEKVIKMVAAVQLKIAKNIIDRGVDVIYESDDIAGKDGPFFPPRIYKKYIWPPIKEVVDMCHKRGIPYIKHSDGDLMPILDEFINFCGFDCLNPIEPQVMDLAEVKRRYGRRISLKGNVDCTWVLPYGTEEDVRRDVRRAIDQGAKGGGFILAESNSMHPNVKFENILIYVDEAKKYGRYPCGKVEAEA